VAPLERSGVRKVFFVALGGEDWWTCQHVDAMRKVGWDPYLFLGPPERFLPEAKNFDPDLLFYFKHPQIVPEWIGELKEETGCRFVQFNGDHRFHIFPEIQNNRPYLDLLLINNSAEVEYYKHLGFNCREWHLGVDPRIHRPYETYEEYDVVFGGNLGRDLPMAEFRRRLIEELDRHFKIAVAGAADLKRGRVFHFIRNEPDYCKFLSSGKITIGVNHFNVPNYYTRRLWLCLAVGRLHLTFYIPNMERDFEKGIHLDWFFDVEEAVDMVGYYLSHDEERERIGRSGQNLAYERHTWVHRYKELRKMLKEV